MLPLDCPCVSDETTRAFLTPKGLLCYLCTFGGYKGLKSNPSPIRKHRRSKGDIQLLARKLFIELRAKLPSKWSDQYIQTKALRLAKRGINP